MLSIKNICKSYDKLQILKDVNLEVKKESLIAIVGASGAGKSTLLHIAGTLDNPDSGQIIINNTDVTTLSKSELNIFRNKHIGFIFQFHHLLPEFSALENVCMPALIAKENNKDAEKRAKDILSLLNLSHRFNHKPNQLSGGEQQRVAIARALINNPSIIFADEPSGNLDSQNAFELHNLFFKLRDEFKQTIITVTHNDQLANMADYKYIMKDGQIIKTITKTT